MKFFYFFTSYYIVNVKYKVNMKNIVVGSGVCPLYVKFKIVDESAEDVAAKAKALKKEIREGGRLYKNYPQSLFDEILSWREVDGNYFENLGARASIVIPEFLIKKFCGDSVRIAHAYKCGEKGKGCTTAVEKSLVENGIEPIFDYLPKGDNQLDISFEDIVGHATARMYQASRTSFKYNFSLDKIENALGENVNFLLLNRAAKGAKKAAEEIVSRSSDNLVFYRVHNFSRHAGVSENVEMLEFANFIFITDPDKNPTITRDLLKYYDVDDLDSLARRILETNELKRVVVIPPSDECENLRFYQTDFNRCVEVKCPDSPRVKTAWLNGSCAALLLKDWRRKAPFKLEGRYPKTYEDFETFADWAVQLAYQDDVKLDFKIAESWIIK